MSYCAACQDTLDRKWNQMLYILRVGANLLTEIFTCKTDTRAAGRVHYGSKLESADQAAELGGLGVSK